MLMVMLMLMLRLMFLAVVLEVVVVTLVYLVVVVVVVVVVVFVVVLPVDALDLNFAGPWRCVRSSLPYLLLGRDGIEFCSCVGSDASTEIETQQHHQLVHANNWGYVEAVTMK